MDALKLYVKHGAPAQSQNYNIYKYITVSMFGQHSLAKPESYKVWSELREFLFDLVSGAAHERMVNGVERDGRSNDNGCQTTACFQSSGCLVL